jgi:hypothetical protein
VIIIEKAVQHKICQVSIKLFNKPLKSLASGFVPTKHPVAVKRIVDIQEQRYLYIKPLETKISILKVLILFLDKYSIRLENIPLMDING